MKATAVSWRDRFDELTAFVDATAEITVGSSILSFYSKEVKADFYILLDRMIDAFVTPLVAQDSLVDYQGVNAFMQVETSLCEKTGISGIKLPQTLRDYLDNPVASALKVLHEPAIGLLQKRLSLEEYEDQASLLVANLFENLNRCIFETWLTYALLDYLSPVAFKTITVLNEQVFEATQAVYLEVGSQYPLKDTRLPEALFMTATGETYAYKFDMSSEINSYATPNKCTDFTSAGNTAGLVCHRTLLLYRTDDFDQVPLLAQRSMRFARKPSLLVEHVSAADFASESVLDQVRRQTLLFGEDARLQVVLTSQDDQDLLEEKLKDSPFVFHTVGYDARSLANVLEPLFTK